MIQEGLFSSVHLLNDDAYISVAQQVPYFVFVIFFGVLFAFSFLCAINPQKISMILIAPFSKRYFLQLQTQGNNIHVGFYSFLLLLICIIESLFLFYLSGFFTTSFENFHSLAQYSIILVLVSGYKVLYLIFVYVVNYLFECQELTEGHLLNTLLFHLLIVIALFPLLILTYFNPGINLKIVFLVIFGLFYIALIIKQLIFYFKNVRLFQFFLYFCTSEILPVLLLVKWYFFLGK